MHEPTRDIPVSELALDLAGERHRSFARRPLLAALVAGSALLAALAGWLAAGPRADWATEPARIGDLVVSVTATGTLQPTDQVDVGSELSGTLRTVEVGYNDPVRAGQVLARLDETRLSAQVLQSKAALEASRAAVEEARANLAEAESQLARLERVRKISGGEVPSQQELTAQEAQTTRARAALASAKALAAQARATLDVQQTDLAKAVIRSPIGGVVLTAPARQGQTVAASLQAPVLFTLAKDLKRLELDLAVDEADVGQVREGQSARFTVDAWPGRTFPARVEQVRFGAKTVAGVVTYETILAVDNPELLLRPGMTATAEIEVRRDSDVLLVPNAALRFEPSSRQAARALGLEALLTKKHPFDVSRGGDEARDRAPQVWTLSRGALRPAPVSTGPSDGAWTEIARGSLEPGTPLVVGTPMQRG